MKNICFTFFSILFVAVAVSFIGCRKEVSSVREDMASNKTVLLTSKIAPGKCRITGTIKKINPLSQSFQDDSPCSKYPCIASVRVDSIWGYGAAFSNPVKTGKEIMLKFEFTLSPASEEIFKNLDTRLPGLEVNSVFSGDIEYLDSSENPDSAGDAAYRIFLYNKIK